VWYEHCQYILIRPVTPVLQTPVPPLQRAADVTPVFNQILMDEQEEYDGPPQKEIPALIVWTLGGKNVYVEGSWDNWKSRYTSLICLYNSV
jgi:5'-AMP-activated protein kinase, regulatory beta subunit